MITTSFYALLFIASMISLSNWRRGMYAFFLIGAIQDPIRKVTSGTPVIISMSVAFVYVAALIGSQRTLLASWSSLSARYPDLLRAFNALFWVLCVAALNGIVTFGLDQWMIPAASMFIYLVPFPALLLGYVFAKNEREVFRLMIFYVLITSVALIGTPLEYNRYSSKFLGTVAMGQDWIRHLPGVQIRILAGFYRSPDIMAWHAAMCCIFAATLLFRRTIQNRWVWGLLATWGFICCLMGGRRKMVFMIPIFLVLFLFRHLKKVNLAQLISIGLITVAIYGVVEKFASQKETSVYTKGTTFMKGELYERFEGGTLETFRQSGYMGLGLGSATQGARHFVARTDTVETWQESGAGKLAVELGLPGFVVMLLVAWTIGLILLRGSRGIGRSGEQDLICAALAAITVANVASFLASHQPFSDPILVLSNAFFLGCFLSLSRPVEAPSTDMAEVPKDETQTALTAVPQHT